jgi:hypothetical protein
MKKPGPLGTGQAGGRIRNLNEGGREGKALVQGMREVDQSQTRTRLM